MTNYQKGFGALLLAGILSLSATNDASAGVYVGLSGGWNQSTDKATLSDTNTVGGVFLTPLKVNSGSALGKIFAGYQFKPVGKLLFGMEAFLIFDSLNIRTYSNAPSNTTDTLQKPYGFGASFLLGTPITERVDIFGKFNIVGRNFKHTLTPPTGQALRSESLRVGVGPGIEVKYKLTENIKLHAETYYTTYRKYTTKTVKSSSLRTYNVTTRPSEYGLLVGLSYSI